MNQNDFVVDVNLCIYDITGRRIKEFDKLAENIIWDGKDDQGRRVPSGIYFVHLKSPEKTVIKKAILLK